MNFFDGQYTDIVLVLVTLGCVVFVVSVISSDTRPERRFVDGDVDASKYRDLDEAMEKAFDREGSETKSSSRTRRSGTDSPTNTNKNEEKRGSDSESRENQTERPDRTPDQLEGPWDRIVIHHSGTSGGTIEGFDRYHREEIGYPDGIKYHFVIGNGQGLGDGEIVPTHRWKKQIPGPQVGRTDVDETAIGICLVGKLNEQPPTSRQREFLDRLLVALMADFDIPAHRVEGARELSDTLTESPGRYLDLEKLRRRLRNMR